MTKDMESRPAAQMTGADALFLQVLQGVAARARAFSGTLAPTTRDRKAQAQQAQRPAPRSAHEALFAEHMGTELVPEVLAQLEAPPMQHYLRARAAMSAEFDRGFRELLARMAKIDL